jgi:hypothetical protein
MVYRSTNYLEKLKVADQRHVHKAQLLQKKQLTNLI